MGVYWFNINSGQVETEENKSKGEDLLGPYDTYAEAAAALQRAAERTESWDEADREWDEANRAPESGQS